MNTLALSYVATLPKVNISEMTKLQWCVELAKSNYADAALATSTAWEMFDLAVEDGNTEAKNELAELAETCETIQREAYSELENAKCMLLALAN